MLPDGLAKHGKRDADGHILPIGMLERMKHDGRLQNRHRAIGHRESRIILTLAVPGVVLTKANIQNTRYLKNFPPSIERLQVHRELDGKAIGLVRRPGKLSPRDLGVDRTRWRLPGVENPGKGLQFHDLPAFAPESRRIAAL